MDSSCVCSEAVEVLVSVVLKDRGKLVRYVKFVEDSSEESASPHQDLNEGIEIGMLSKGGHGEQNIQRPTSRLVTEANSD